MTQQLQLAEPLVSAMVTLLEANLNTAIDTLNASLTDNYHVDHVQQILPYVPVPSTLQGGLPCVGVQDLPGLFVDDLQFAVDMEHEYAVVAIVQQSDQLTLAWQLRRTMQAIANTIQADRLATNGTNPAGVMRTQGGAWAVNFIRTEPGPLLGDFDPVSLEGPPRSYLSWVALVCSSKRTEVGTP